MTQAAPPPSTRFPQARSPSRWLSNMSLIMSRRRSAPWCGQARSGTRTRRRWT